MGWSSATEIFDEVAKEVLVNRAVNKKVVIKALYKVLRDGDWDTEAESKYYNHPIVQEIIEERRVWLNNVKKRIKKTCG